MMAAMCAYAAETFAQRMVAHFQEAVEVIIDRGDEREVVAGSFTRRRRRAALAVTSGGMAAIPPR